MKNTLTCSCGHEMGSHNIDMKRSYSWWGWFLLYFGISTTPHKAEYFCVICNDVVETITEYAKLRKIGRY